MKKNLLILLFLLFLCNPTTSETDPYSPSAVLEFADSLAASGDTSEAAWEYERYLFLAGNPESRAVASLADIYKTGGEYEKSLLLIDRYLPDIKAENSRKDLLVLKGYTLLEMKNWNGLDTLLASPEIRAFDAPAFRALSVTSLVYQQKYPLALESARACFDDEQSGNLIRLLGEYRRKSPPLALFLSSLIPGLGKAYAEQYGDAIFSFLTVAALSGFAGYSYYTEGPSSWRPWVYGVGAGFFYSANLYGSHQAALRFNSFQDRRLREAADELEEKYQN